MTERVNDGQSAGPLVGAYGLDSQFLRQVDAAGLDPPRGLGGTWTWRLPTRAEAEKAAGPTKQELKGQSPQEDRAAGCLLPPSVH